VVGRHGGNEFVHAHTGPASSGRFALMRAEEAGTPRQQEPLGGFSGAPAAPDEARRRLDHDVLHELSTIALLASLLNSSADLGPENRRWAKQIMTEIRWLEKLVRSYQNAGEDPVAGLPGRQPVRVDLLVKGIVQTARAHTETRITCAATPATVLADRTSLGRALRNLIWNALKAAGEAGHVDVHVLLCDGSAVVDIHNDGPAFDPGKRSGTRLGLEIVRQVVAAYDGEVQIGGSPLGGCRVTLRLPAVSGDDEH
jgi:two-component system sensor histidine kinase BaeS